MNPLKNVGRKFQTIIKRYEGSSFYGHILGLPDTSRVSNFLSARRYLRTSDTCSVNPSDVITTAGVTYIVAEHGEGFYGSVIYKHFKLFEVDEVANWYTMVETTDAITGIVTKERSATPTIVYLSTQPTNSIQDTMKIPVGRKIAICNKNVSIDDIIGKYIVTKVDKVIGVYLVELKDS